MIILITVRLQGRGFKGFSLCSAMIAPRPVSRPRANNHYNPNLYQTTHRVNDQRQQPNTISFDCTCLAFRFAASQCA